MILNFKKIKIKSKSITILVRIEAAKWNPELPIQIRHVLSPLAVIRLVHLGGGLILLRFVRECNLYIRAWKIICAFIARDSPFSLWTMRCEALLKATFEYKPNVNDSMAHGSHFPLIFDISTVSLKLNFLNRIH